MLASCNKDIRVILNDFYKAKYSVDDKFLSWLYEEYKNLGDKSLDININNWPKWVMKKKNEYRRK